MKKMKEQVSVAGSGRLRLSTLLCCGFVLLWCWACKDDDSRQSSYDPQAAVEVTEIIPDSGRINIPLVIHGKNFGEDTSRIKVMFDEKEAIILSAQNEHLYVLVPKQHAGKHQVKVVVDGTNEGVAKQEFQYILTSAVTTVAGNGERDDIDGDALDIGLYRPSYLDVDDQNNIIFVDGSSLVRLLSMDEGKVKTLANVSDIYACCFSKDFNNFYVAIESTSGTRIAYNLSRKGNWAMGTMVNDGNYEDYPCGITIDDNGDFLIIGYYGYIARMDHVTQEIKNLGVAPDLLLGAAADFNIVYNPRDKYAYVSSYKSHVIFRFDPYKDELTDDDFELYAGSIGGAGYMDGPASQSAFDGPRGMDFDSEGNMYVADMNNHAIRMITPDGIVSTYVGGKGRGATDGTVDIAKFNGPSDVAISPDDKVYVADQNNYKIRCVVIQ